MASSLVTKALEEVWSLPAEPIGSCGCGRAYVVFSEPKGVVNAVAAAAKSLGLLFLRTAYGTSGNALYCGYDNADGRALGKAHVVSEALNAKGFRTYVDAVED
jgi:hypothetical protein